MPRISEPGRYLWVKVVGMLKQNWATVESSNAAGVQVRFITDTGGIFDEMTFGSEAEADAKETARLGRVLLRYLIRYLIGCLKDKGLSRIRLSP